MSDTEIRLYKLFSGEEVVGEFVEETEDYLVLRRPRVMIPTPVGPGQMSIQMAPYVITAADTNVRIYLRAIAGEVLNVPKDLEDGYIHQTTGVQIAPAGDRKSVV